jgi:hypothetical protein
MGMHSACGISPELSSAFWLAGSQGGRDFSSGMGSSRQASFLGGHLAARRIMHEMLFKTYYHARNKF